MKLPARAPRKQSGNWLAALAVLTVIAIGTGGALGIHLVSKTEMAVEARRKAEADKTIRTPEYTGDTVVRSLEPIITNLHASGDAWIRIEASILFNRGDVVNPAAMAAEIKQDVLAYARTLTLRQLEGASGLQHLREDLNERAHLRSDGRVRELILETVVVQ